MRLEDYLGRIGFRGDPRPDLPTLNAIVAAQVAAVPFENIDVQLGLPLDTTGEAAWEKIVHRGRGGWCYEANAVLGAALQKIGFPVRRVAGGVMRQEGASDAFGGHLALTVECEGERWLADAGFGSKLARPLRLAAGERTDSPFTVSLSKLSDGHWRYTEEGCGAAPFWFDFADAPADESLLAARCVWQQTAAESNFVGRLTVQIRDGGRHLALRDRVLSISSPHGLEQREITDFAEWAALLRGPLKVPLDAAPLWDVVRSRAATATP